MRKKTALLASLLWLLSCNNSEEKAAAPESDVDAARTFIRHALNGEYKAAQRLLVQDSANLEWLAAAERAYTHNDVTEQRGLRESSIQIHDTKKLNDSTSVIAYSNSFKKRRQVVKAVRQKGAWLVDLKYTFQNTDSTAK